jgi:steroid 5-alpha reductase family enzyme
MPPTAPFELGSWLAGLAPLLAAAALTWIVSVAKRNVTIVDTLWPLLFVIAALAYALVVPTETARRSIVLALVTVWGLRLAVYLGWRSHGQPEDRRYQEIRRRNEPNFAVKSLYLVFGLQAILAWIISLPLLGAVTSPLALGWLDWAGLALWSIGFVFEAGGDWQLARFKADPANRGKVMDRGFWRYTRHPNYFGDFCVWWGFYLMALSGGAWWSLPGPLLMSWLLLKVSGVTLLEKDIAGRRPEYADYVRRTNAFFPGPRNSDVR